MIFDQKIDVQEIILLKLNLEYHESIFCFANEY